MLHVMTVLGARPQFVKAAPVSRALAAAGVRETLVHTGQHYDDRMSGVFFEQLGIANPAHHLEVGSAGHGAQTGRMMERLEPIVMDVRPDWVLVYGDTNSTVAAALVAAKLHVPIAHVEAGLRSFDRRMPEEVNRVVTDHLAARCYAPTTTAAENLAAEGIAAARVRIVGDVMHDAVLQFGAAARARSGILDELGLTPGGYAVATIHRPENTETGARMEAIVSGLERVAEKLPVVWPVHPRLRERLRGTATGNGIIRCEPLPYLEMLALQQSAAVIATDSGGLQKEAFFARVPCVTLRDTTEWVETVTLGWNRLVMPSSEAVVADSILAAIGAPGEAGAPYGEGDAATRIASDLLSGEVS